jgi:hypothetical protein
VNLRGPADARAKISFNQSSEGSPAVAEAKKAKLEFDPIGGTSILKMVNGLYEIEPAIVSRVIQIIESK